jgi:beta-glucosidase-like glycosyl hydrolase
MHGVNNQEADRRNDSAVVDARTQCQLYRAPFEDAVAAGVLTVMCRRACFPRRACRAG